MKKFIALVVAVAATFATASSVEARDRGYGRHTYGHRHGGYCAPRPVCPPPVFCPPPVHYAPRYCAPRPVCPPRYAYGFYGHGVRPAVQLSFSYGGYRRCR